MGLGPPSCDKCHVWLHLVPPNVRDQHWECPVCGVDSKNGYTHLFGGSDVLPSDVIPLLKFLHKAEE
jgi:hypothetical protein